MTRKWALEIAQRMLLAVMIASSLAIAYLILQGLWAITSESAQPTPVAIVLTPTPIPTPTRVPPSPTPTKPPKTVGLVAGHWGYDSGAVCPDGLTEVEINLAIAQSVKALLEGQGYAVDLLEEFDAKLEGYLADALVSIHADSCDVPRVSGFKVASVLQSVLPEEEDHLVKCLREEYQAATGLSFHQYSITYDMREYHAFYEIASQTPAAIIETGFMGADRHILLEQQDKVAQGIANGIVRFIDTDTD